jgi:hypothetical protein
LSSASPRLAHRCHLSATCCAYGAPARMPSAQAPARSGLGRRSGLQGVPGATRRACRRCGRAARRSGGGWPCPKDRSIPVTPACREVVDPEHPRSDDWRVRERLDQPQQGHAADADGQGGGQAGAAAASQGQRDHGQQLGQAAGAAAVADGEARDLLGEGAPGAGRGGAEQPPDPQGEAHLLLPGGGVAVEATGVLVRLPRTSPRGRGRSTARRPERPGPSASGALAARYRTAVSSTGPRDRLTCSAPKYPSPGPCSTPDPRPQPSAASLPNTEEVTRALRRLTVRLLVMAIVGATTILALTGSALAGCKWY